MTKSTQKAKNEGMKDVSFEGGEREREREGKRPWKYAVLKRIFLRQSLRPTIRPNLRPEVSGHEILISGCYQTSGENRRFGLISGYSAKFAT